MRRRGPVLVLLLCLLGIGLVYGISAAVVRDQREALGARYTVSVTPVPAGLIRMVAGEFKGLMSDFLLLEIGAFIGSNKKVTKEEWDRVILALRQALELDPYFQQTYIYVQGNIPWDPKEPETANELLDVSRRHRTWDWRPGYYMGFNSYYFLSDFGRASELFLETARIKGAPALLAVLGGRFALKTGREKAAVALLESMLDDPEMDDATRREIAMRIEALQGVMVLEAAVAAYRQAQGKPPADLNALVDAGILQSLPANPYKTSYVLDPNTGQVKFDTVK